MKRSENTEEDTDDREPADGDTQMEYSFDLLYSRSVGTVTKNCM
jgi:hypothetical protein